MTVIFFELIVERKPDILLNNTLTMFVKLHGLHLMTYSNPVARSSDSSAADIISGIGFGESCIFLNSLSISSINL